MPAGRPAARRRSTSSPATADTGAALVDHPGVDKVAFTGSTEVGKAISAAVAGTGKQAHAGAGRQGGEHRLRRRARSTRRSRASSTASSSTRATSAARARGCWCRSRSPTPCSTGSSGGWPRCASATRWTRTPTSARSTRGEQLDKIREPGRGAARPRARSAGRRRASCSQPRATGSRRRCSPASASRTGSPGRRSSGRCCRCSRSAPGRGGGEGEQHPLRAVGRGLDREGQPDPVDGATSCAPGVVWANTYNRFDPASPFGGYQESGFGREGGRAGLAAYLDA